MLNTEGKKIAEVESMFEGGVKVEKRLNSFLANQSCHDKQLIRSDFSILHKSGGDSFSRAAALKAVPTNVLVLVCSGIASIPTADKQEPDFGSW